MLDDTPILHTKRLRLEPFSEDHLTDRYVAWLNDPEVVRYSEQRHRRHTKITCRTYLRSFQDSPNHFWAIIAPKESVAHIGNISAAVDRHNLVADLAIMIGEKLVWGKGYGAEAWVAVCRWLLIDGGLRKVTAGTMAANEGMLGLMQATDMRREGGRRRQFLLEGKEVDLVQAGLFREDLE